MAAGRSFTDAGPRARHAGRDRQRDARPQHLARRGSDRQAPSAGDGTDKRPWVTVVGVVKDLRRADVKRADPPRGLCLHAADDAADADAAGAHGRRSRRRSCRRSAASCRRIDPQLPLFRVTTLGAAGGRHAQPAALPGDAARRLRADRAAAGDDRHLRRDVARGEPADAGGRHPDGDGRAALGRAAG